MYNLKKYLFVGLSARDFCVFPEISSIVLGFNGLLAQLSTTVVNHSKFHVIACSISSAFSFKTDTSSSVDSCGIQPDKAIAL